MERKARELGNAGTLRAYLVVLRMVSPEGKETVRSLCYTAPSWSHVAARYDQPENGVEIIRQEFLASGEVSVVPLAYKAKMAEITGEMKGLEMCYQCEHDFRVQPNMRCSLGHRTDNSPAEPMCHGFRPKVK